MSTPRRNWGLLQQRQCVVPTWRGWLLLAGGAMALATLAIKAVSPFLSINDPIPGGALVVEGWAADYALAEAIAEFGRHHYTKLYVTGGPLEVGAPLSEYITFAELGAATVCRMGLDKAQVQAVPAPLVPQDRTYTSAIALRNWLRQQHAMPASVNVISVGAHARRSRLLFAKAFRQEARVGIIAVENQSYDSRHWWRSSVGVRTVSDEVVAYLYSRLFFYAPHD